MRQPGAAFTCRGATPSASCQFPVAYDSTQRRRDSEEADRALVFTTESAEVTKNGAKMVLFIVVAVSRTALVSSLNQATSHAVN